MPFQYTEGLKYYSFPSIAKEVRHGIFTRVGGTSPKPWESLNMGNTVGDESGRVTQNRQLAFGVLKLDNKSLFDVWQVHSATVALAGAPRAMNEDYQKADVILTNQPKVTLMMRFADCTPILLHDPVNKVIGLVHAGWMGTVKMAAKIAVEAMVENYGSNPEDIRAAIGPSIGPDHYEVGTDVIEKVRKTFGEINHVLIEKINGKFHFDLWEGNRLLLQIAGVKKIEVAGLCTACNLGDWFSHRAEKGKTGRFGVLASLEHVNE
jgi:YfiH family protein